MFSIIREIIERKNLIYELVLKDIKLRYSRPFLGFLWAFLSPFFTAIIFYLVFSLFLNIKTKEMPFILYLMSATFPWRLFQDSVTSSTSSLIDNKNLIKEARFPYYFIPISIILANLIIFLPCLPILIIISMVMLKGLPVFLIFLPLVILVHLIITTGLALIFSLLYLKWRDTKYILEFLLLFLFYLTPCFYPLSLVKNTFSPFLYSIYVNNPFVGILNLYRCTLLKGFFPLISKEISIFSLIIVPIIFSLFLFLTGFYLYSKYKNKINDYLFN